MLYFDISFDFFFVKLKGVWFVFVKVEIKNIIVIGNNGKKN